jgi:hypothetical protein
MNFGLNHDRNEAAENRLWMTVSQIFPFHGAKCITSFLNPVRYSRFAAGLGNIPKQMDFASLEQFGVIRKAVWQRREVAQAMAGS